MANVGAKRPRPVRDRVRLRRRGSAAARMAGLRAGPEWIRVYRDGVTLGHVAAESGDGCFEAGGIGRLQVRYAWIDDDEIISYAPGDFWRGFRECSGLPDTLALYRRDGEGRYAFLHEEAIGWPPPFRRRHWIEWEDLSLATRLEYMTGRSTRFPSAPTAAFGDDRVDPVGTMAKAFSRPR